MLDAHFLDTLRAPLDDSVMEKTVARWMTLFVEARIPASRLMQVYNTAIKSKKRDEYFSVSTILQTWDEMQKESTQSIKAVDLDCHICSGSGKASVMNFETGEDEERDCICAASSARKAK